MQVLNPCYHQCLQCGIIFECKNNYCAKPFQHGRPALISSASHLQLILSSLLKNNCKGVRLRLRFQSDCPCFLCSIINRFLFLLSFCHCSLDIPSGLVGCRSVSLSCSSSAIMCFTFATMFSLISSYVISYAARSPREQVAAFLKDIAY
jgi:hypothetical protein